MPRHPNALLCKQRAMSLVRTGRERRRCPQRERRCQGKAPLGCHDPKLAYGDPLEVTGHTRMSAGLGAGRRVRGDRICAAVECSSGLMAAAGVWCAVGCENAFVVLVVVYLLQGVHLRACLLRWCLSMPRTSAWALLSKAFLAGLLPPRALSSLSLAFIPRAPLFPAAWKVEPRIDPDPPGPSGALERRGEKSVAPLGTEGAAAHQHARAGGTINNVDDSRFHRGIISTVTSGFWRRRRSLSSGMGPNWPSVLQ